MSNKKVKKNKGTTLSLQAFNAQIQDGKAPSAGQNVVYASKKPTYTNWADEMDEEELTSEMERIILPAGPRSSRGPNVDDSQIPRSPPFTVHLSNVAYEIGDEDIYNFFRDMKIISVRIPRDPGNKPKGYAYIDFENREDLISALTMTDQQLKGRAVRISLGEGQNRRDGGPGRGPGGGSYSDATPSDWRSDMRPNSPPRRDGPGGGGGGFNDFRRGNDFNRGGDFERGGGGRDRDRGFGGGPDMTRDQMTGGRRGGFNDFPERGDRDHFQRDRSGSNEMGSNWRNERPAGPPEPDFYRNSYGGGGGPRPGPDYSDMRMRDGPPRGQDNRGQYDRGYQRNASPPPRSGGGYQEERGRRGYDAPIRASREASPSTYRNTAPPENEADRSDSDHGSVKQSNEPSRERKKLVLAPRTVTAQVAEPAPETSSAIFGGAKPVDTAAREKEIEEKLLSLDLRTTRVRSDSHVSDEPRIRILQRTPEERDRRDREIRERKQRERYPSTSSEKSRDLQYRHSIPQDLPKILQLPRTRSPTSTSTTTVPPVASSFCSENFHPSNNPPTSKHFQRSEEEDDFEHDESSTKPKPLEVRNEMVHNENENIEPLKNPWNRRKDIRDEDVPRRQVYESDRKTPDFDRNSEKEKDTNSDPEDDRDSHHRFINEDNVRNKEEDDDDDDFHKVSRSRPRRDRDRDGDKGIREDGSRGDRRGGYGGRGGGGGNGGSSGGGGYSGSGSGPRQFDPSRRGDRGDFGPRRQPYGRVGGDGGRDRDGGGGGGGARSTTRGGGGYSSGGPPHRDR